MKKVRNVLLIALSFVLVAVLSVGATLAYLQDEDGAVNVMTVGNVKIEQLEYERVVDENGNWVKSSYEAYGYTADLMQEFTQAKPALPAIYNDGTTKWDDRNGSSAASGTGSHQQPWLQIGAPGSNQLFDDSVGNVIDKFVFVKNTGIFDAYYRTIIAIEDPKGNTADIHFNKNGHSFFIWNDLGYVEIEGVRYALLEAVYTEVLKPGEVSRPSLLQVFLDPSATNEDCASFGPTWDVLVMSQAVQATGFKNDANGNGTFADEALDVAFGKTSATVHPWVSGVEIPTVFTWADVNYVTEGDTVKVSSAGGDTIYRGILSEGNTEASDIVIGEGITRLNNRSLCKDAGLKTVTLPNSLTYIDESVFQQSGFVSIEIPENVTYIGKQAMGACPDLETITIKAKNVTIANYVARACANLKEVYIYSDTVTFESGSMYFTNKENADASGITFYVGSQAVADTLYSAFSTSSSYGLLIKSLDGNTVYYDTLKN